MRESGAAARQAYLRRAGKVPILRRFAMPPIERLNSDSCKLRFTLRQIQQAKEENLGYCTVCGASRKYCESTAEDYPCDACGELAVYGPDWLLMADLVK